MSVFWMGLFSICPIYSFCCFPYFGIHNRLLVLVMIKFFKEYLFFVGDIRLSNKFYLENVGKEEDIYVLGFGEYGVWDESNYR